MPMTWRDKVLAILVALVWGMGFVVAKSAMDHFPPILLMAFRFALTAMALVWFAPFPTGNLRRLFLIALIAAGIQYSLTFTGLKGLEAGIAALVVQLEVPFLVLLGAIILKERPTLQKWFGILVAFLGVGVIAEQVEFAGQWVSMLLVIGGAFTWAFGQVLVRRIPDISGLTVTAWIAVFATPQLFVMSALFETGQIDAIQQSTPKVWWAVIYLGMVMTAFGYFLWNTLIRTYDVGRVAPFLLLLPLFSVLGGIAFLEETMTLSKLLGGAIVLAGIALITLERAPRQGPDVGR